MKHTGTLQPGQSYTASLTANVPSLTPGPYHIFVRADIFNQTQLPPGVPISSKTGTSAGLLSVTVDSLTLGVPYPTTLSTDQERLLQVTVPAGATLEVLLTANGSDGTNEIFIKQGAAPTDSVYDAAYSGGLAPNQMAVVPTTIPGVYYILIRGHSEPADNTPIDVLAQLLPLSINNVQTDQGGDSQYVTTTISGAQFQPNAIVKLVMPGFAEYQPLTTDYVNSTEIIAEFNLTGAPHGLYDVQVTNPDGQQAIAAYRFEVEQTVSPNVTVALGGPRFILAGDTGTYNVQLDNLGNVNAPYVEFNIGVPELSNDLPPTNPNEPLELDPINVNLYNLPYLQFTTNLSGAPPDSSLSSQVPYATLQAQADTAAAGGHVQAPGYLFNEAAGGSTGFSFDITTYPGLAALNDRNFDALKAQLYAAFPQYAAEGILDNGPQGLDLIEPGLYELYELFGQIPNIFTIPFVPFQFDINASATTLTRAEFVSQETAAADQLRAEILADPTAPIALENLAASQTNWENLYLAALEQAGILLPDGATPPIMQNPLIMSEMAMLATGVLAGPAGSGIISSGNVAQFFSELLDWYGNDPDATAPVAYYNDHGNPVATLPPLSQFDLDAASPTNYEDFNVYVPWLNWGSRADLPPSFQITSVQEVNGVPVIPLDLDQYINNGAQDAGLASMTGPFTAEDNGFIPAGQPLPFTVNFQNAPQASTSPGEIRITTQLDPSLDPSSFRLGDIKIGDIDISIPSNMALFQGDFDFTQTNGFILRVSAGVDVQTGIATWLLEAIDPLTGEVISNPEKGLLPPNDAEGDGAGFVTYTIEPFANATTGATVTATATVLFNTAAPQDTAPLAYTLDSIAPTTQTTVSQIGANPNYQVQWTSTDNSGGSGVKYVTIYVAEDGGSYEVWQDQLAESSGTMIYSGQAGHTYTFLVLATDVAGNQEQPPAGTNANLAPSTVNLGAPPTVPSTTPPNFGTPPPPTVQPSTNPLFTQAQLGVPNTPPATNPSEFQTVIDPFQAQSFATGFAQSDSILGPMALVQEPDGSFLVSGGALRNELFHIPRFGGAAGTPLATLPYQIYAMAFDSAGHLWAATGGGPLLQLNPATGAIVNQFGDGITLALAVNPQTQQIYVSSGKGVEIFNPSNDTFTQYSRDQNLRVSSLAFDASGNLWAVTWPDSRQVVEFTAQARAQVMLSFDSDIQSITFGLAGTALENLLFVSHDDAPNTPPGTVATTPTELTMVDVTTLQQVAVASGGTRGFAVLATSDGRVLISQSHEVDVLSPVVPPQVIASNPPSGATESLPLGTISITFDHDMFEGSPTDSRSALNPANYQLLSDTGITIPITAVSYDTSSRTAVLATSAMEPGGYTITVKSSIESTDGLALAQAYSSHFLTITDITPEVTLDFYAGRSNAATKTYTYSLTITNNSPTALLSPFYLTFDGLTPTGDQVLSAMNPNAQGTVWLDVDSVITSGKLAPGQTSSVATVTFYNPSGGRLTFKSGLLGAPLRQRESRDRRFTLAQCERGPDLSVDLARP